MPTLSVRRLLELVEARFGEPQADLAAASLQSVAHRLSHARLHFREIESLLSRFKAARLDERSVFEVAFGPDLEIRSEYYELMDAIGAHAVACVQAIHAVSDLLANCVFYCLKLDAGGPPLAPEKVDSRRVREMLARSGPQKLIKDAMEALAADAAFAHVDALSNKAKHSSVVRTALNEDMTGERERRHELRFQPFHRKGVDYPESRIEDALRPAYSIASSTFIDVGNLLIAALNS